MRIFRWDQPEIRLALIVLGAVAFVGLIEIGAGVTNFQGSYGVCTRDVIRYCDRVRDQGSERALLRCLRQQEQHFEPACKRLLSKSREVAEPRCTYDEFSLADCEALKGGERWSCLARSNVIDQLSPACVDQLKRALSYSYARCVRKSSSALTTCQRYLGKDLCEALLPNENANQTCQHYLTEAQALSADQISMSNQRKERMP